MLRGDEEKKNGHHFRLIIILVNILTRNLCNECELTRTLLRLATTLVSLSLYVFIFLGQNSATTQICAWNIGSTC